MSEEAAIEETPAAEAAPEEASASESEAAPEEAVVVKAVAAKTKKKGPAAKPKTAVSNHPPFANMITTAVKVNLKKIIPFYQYCNRNIIFFLYCSI